MIKPIRIKIKGELPDNHFAYAMASINGRKEVGIVTDLTRDCILSKCGRFEKSIESVDVRIAIMYKKI